MTEMIDMLVSVTCISVTNNDVAMTLHANERVVNTPLVYQKTPHYYQSWCPRDIMECVHLGSCHCRKFPSAGVCIQAARGCDTVNACGPPRV